MCFVVYLAAEIILNMNTDTLECPVDLIPVNQNKIRLIALQVWLLAITFWFVHSTIILLLLTADFFLRAFRLQQYSPLAFIAQMVIKQAGIKNKPVDQAPKRFAARLGFAMTLILTLLNYAEITLAVNVLVLMLVLFSFLESFLGICVGCYIYTLTQRVARVLAR